MCSVWNGEVEGYVVYGVKGEGVCSVWSIM